MPETMSPREKVARIVDPDAWSTKDVMEWHGLVVQDVETKSAIDFSLSVYEPILAALASSGDHAELVASLRKPEIWQSYPGPEGDFEIRLAPFDAATALEALIAKVAALRGACDHANEHWKKTQAVWSEVLVATGCKDGGELVDKANRATEAERKLAEAVGLLSELEQHVRAASEGRGHARAGIKSADAARTFLSKEAERG